MSLLWWLVTTDPRRGSLLGDAQSPSRASGFAFRLHGVISDGGLAAIDAIDAMGAIGAMGAIDAIDAIGAIGGGWGCPWGCLKKLAVSFWDDAS